MIDNFSLFVSHGLMLLAAWRLLGRADLDSDKGERTGWFRPKAGARGNLPDA